MDWRKAVLQGLGAPITPGNLRFLQTWQRWEGGHTNNDARFNWLNTTQGDQFPSINSVNVRAFPDFSTGVAQTIATIQNGRYGDIVQALKSGRPFRAAPSAGLQTWVSGSATGNPDYARRILGNRKAAVPGQPAAVTSEPLGFPKEWLSGQKAAPEEGDLGFPAEWVQGGRKRARGGDLGFPREWIGDQPVTVDKDARMTANAKRAIALAKELLGVKYVWGGASPSGIDCSGLISYVHAKLGIQVPHYTVAQWRTGKEVERGQLRPGDAVFFHWGSHPTTGETGPQHVGMYIGNGQFIEAPYTGATVRIRKLNSRDDYVGARRYI